MYIRGGRIHNTTCVAWMANSIWYVTDIHKPNTLSQVLQAHTPYRTSYLYSNMWETKFRVGVQACMRVTFIPSTIRDKWKTVYLLKPNSIYHSSRIHYHHQTESNVNHSLYASNRVCCYFVFLFMFCAFFFTFLWTINKNIYPSKEYYTVEFQTTQC